jgi:hypothetical protein
MSTISYEQAAAIIPKSEIERFLSEHGFRINMRNPSVADVSCALREAVRKGGPPVAAAMESLAQKHAKSMGGCKCDGGCSGCGAKKSFNAEAKSNTTAAVVPNQFTAFVQKNSTLLIVAATAIIVAMIWKKG